MTTNKTLLKVIGYGSRLLLAVFAVLFWMIAICAFICGILDSDLFSVVITGVAAFIGWVCWNLKKEIL